ncbi:MAG: DJ-1/PfpI family protein [Campylobacteraceae bacterium]
MQINIFLFNDFETLDVFGPVEIFGKVDEFKLDYFSIKGGVIVSKQGTQIITKSHEEVNQLEENVLLIPGGFGTRSLVEDKKTIKILKSISSKSTYTLCVCTGSALLAKTGLLDEKTATTNKKSFDWVVSQNKKVKWQRSARWCVDEKFYTSSGVSAGIDMSLAFVEDLYGVEKAKNIAHHIEYVWNDDKENDKFC